MQAVFISIPIRPASRPRNACTQSPGNRLAFAPALIAAKPLKPCDRGVFRGGFFCSCFCSGAGAIHAPAGGVWAGLRGRNQALGLLRGRPRKRPARQQKPGPFGWAGRGFRLAACDLRLATCGADRFGLRRSRLAALFRQTACKRPVSRPQSSAPRSVQLPNPRPGNRPNFAPDSIAEKPLKPCDRGVFRGSFFAPVFAVEPGPCMRPLAGFGRV